MIGDWDYEEPPAPDPPIPLGERAGYENCELCGEPADYWAGTWLCSDHVEDDRPGPDWQAIP